MTSEQVQYPASINVPAGIIKMGFSVASQPVQRQILFYAPHLLSYEKNKDGKTYKCHDLENMRKVSLYCKSVASGQIYLSRFDDWSIHPETGRLMRHCTQLTNATAGSGKMIPAVSMTLLTVSEQEKYIKSVVESLGYTQTNFHDLNLKDGQVKPSTTIHANPIPISQWTYFWYVDRLYNELSGNGGAVVYESGRFAQMRDPVADAVHGIYGTLTELTKEQRAKVVSEITKLSKGWEK